MKITAEFVTSAAAASGLPHEGLPEVALVGRSNVGKSSLINALVRQRLARTSAAPGKTRLANVYRVVRGGQAPFFLVDLPGYGYARGGGAAAREFQALTESYFQRAAGQVGRVRQVSQVGGQVGDEGDLPAPPPGLPASPARPAQVAALLLVDARHTAMAVDVEAWRWLQSVVEERGIVATKADKLPRGQRIRSVRELESVFQHPVLPVSAETGEGLDELWKLIDRLANNRKDKQRSSSRPPRETAPLPPSKVEGPKR